MMTEYEARKLSESMHMELNATSRAVWQCAAGLIIVISMTVAGSWLREAGSDSGPVAGVAPQSQGSSANVDQAQERAEAAFPTEIVHANTGAAGER